MSLQEVNRPRSVRTGEEVARAEPLVPEYASYPPLRVFFRGVPGIRYLYALAKNSVKFRRLGWEMVNPYSAFVVSSPDGTPYDFVVMGRGKRIAGASVEAMLPPLELDSEADSLLPHLSPNAKIEEKIEEEKPDAEIQSKQAEPEKPRREGKDREGDARVQPGQPPLR